MKLLRRLAGWLRPKLPYVNIGLVLVAYLANEFFFVQTFCQPVRWAALLLLGDIGAFLAWPWLGRAPAAVRYAALLLQGAVVPSGVYCAWFLGGPTMLLVSLLAFFFVVPLLAWVPVVVVAQALRRGFTTPLPGARLVFGLGMLGPLLAQGWAEKQFRQVEAAVAGLPPARRYDPAALAAVVPRSYLAERLAGTLFKYHNYYTDYDGWRPPLHDPLVNVCLWLRMGQDFDKAGVRQANPLLLGYRPVAGRWPDPGVDKQVALYHMLFPQEPVKVDCACSYAGDAQGYYRWHPGPASR